MATFGNRIVSEVIMNDPLGNAVDPTSALPSQATQVNASSGNVSNSVAAATLPAVASKTNFLTGFEISGSGATVGLPVSVTIIGVLGGTLTYTYNYGAGALVGNQPLMASFFPPLQASALNTAITVSCPAGGVGNTSNTCNVHGYLK